MSIHILHLSDVHFKRKDQEVKVFRGIVQENLIDVVTVHLKEHNKLDFVLVTGDIAFSGKKNEYNEAFDFFEKLKQVLPAGIQFLAVPGNHDVDRKEVDRFLSMHCIVKNRQTDEFLVSKKHIKNFINTKFNRYMNFIHRLNPTLYESPNDYFWVKNFSDKNVSFWGLNSCWACENDDDINNITLGLPQVNEAKKKSSTSNRILLMHHPIGCLNQPDLNRYRDDIFHNCCLILHGHNHMDNALVLKNPADSCICLGANASYTQDEDGFIGFQFVEVWLTQGSTAVEVWPYRLDTKGHLRFVPDYTRWEGQKGPSFTLSTTGGSEGAPLKLEIPRDYIDWLSEFHSTLPVDQLSREGEVVLISLPEVYIPLETTNPFYKCGDENDMKKSGEPITIDIEELVGRKKCLLLRGKAGMGKTTLLKHLAYSLTHGVGPAALRGYLPVLVFLKDIWPIYKERLRRESATITFESLLKLYFKSIQCPLPMRILNAYLSQDHALLMLDGLDEVPKDIRDKLVDMMHRFQFKYERNRFLITSRPQGINGKGMFWFGKYLQDIHELDNKKMDCFISRWFNAAYPNAQGLAGPTARDMISDIHHHAYVSVFTRNPLLLTALCIFYQVEGKKFPDQRADLYDRIVFNLIYRRFHESDPELVSRVHEYLMSLAFTMQKRNCKSIEDWEAMEVLKEMYPSTDAESPAEYKKRIEKLFNRIEPVCGLLHRMSSGEIEFAHLSFQEFLAANYMLDMDFDYKKFLKYPWWEETILLYTGLMNLRMKKKSNKIVSVILNKYKQPRVQLLGSRALRDFHPIKREEEVVTLTREKLGKIIRSDTSIEERFEAGEILGTLGDPRIDIQTPPLVTVDAGKFTRGSTEDKRESPVCDIYLDEFMIGKYPVTNEEFKAFIADGGYNKKDYWTSEGWQWLQEKKFLQPRYWYDRKWTSPNFPVMGVSWHEASAYARWLSQKTGEIFDLPTEVQWEKAARGIEGLIYPWGNDFDAHRCNSDEFKRPQTSPVGIYPGGESPYGCMDMSGNVWEWCADWYEKNYYQKSPKTNPQGPSQGSHKVVRGGGWGSGCWRCRTTCRVDVYPTNREIDLGFRLVKSLVKK